jgi:hypothetical protein
MRHRGKRGETDADSRRIDTATGCWHAPLTVAAEYQAEAEADADADAEDVDVRSCGG